MVVAHPDDEALWLSSVLRHAEKVIFCIVDIFGDRPATDRRNQAIRALPLQNIVCLSVPGSGTFHYVDWSHPNLTEYGVEIGDPAARIRYKQNYARLLEELAGQLTDVDLVFTHNPWGDYGHPEHIQVYRAVSALQKEHGFDLAFSNYIGPRSQRLATTLAGRFNWDRSVRLVTDRRRAHKLEKIYKRHDIWTWDYYHRWPLAETIYICPAGGEGLHESLIGQPVLDTRGLRWWPPPAHLVHRQL